jgi:NAD(P)-dependent dehydrogenase (short-subunit alcohol dehydrogenase family)
VEATKILADVTKFSEAQRFIKETVATFGAVDVLVNVVGGTIWWRPTTAIPKNRSLEFIVTKFRMEAH